MVRFYLRLFAAMVTLNVWCNAQAVEFVPVGDARCQAMLEQAFQSFQTPFSRELVRTHDFDQGKPTSNHPSKHHSANADDHVIFYSHNSGKEFGDTPEAIETSAERLLHIQKAVKKGRRALARATDADVSVAATSPTKVPGPRVLILEGGEINAQNIALAQKLMDTAGQSYEGKPYDTGIDESDTTASSSRRRTGGDDDGEEGGFSGSLLINPVGSVAAMLVRWMPDRIRDSIWPKDHIANTVSYLGFIWGTGAVGSLMGDGTASFTDSALQIAQTGLEYVHISLDPRVFASIVCVAGCGYQIFRDARPNHPVVGYVEKLRNMVFSLDDETVEVQHQAAPVARHIFMANYGPEKYFDQLMADLNRHQEDHLGFAHVGVNYFLPKPGKRLASDEELRMLDDDDKLLPKGSVDQRDKDANRSLDVIYFHRVDESGESVPVMMFVDLSK